MRGAAAGINEGAIDGQGRILTDGEQVKHHPL